MVGKTCTRGEDPTTFFAAEYAKTFLAWMGQDMILELSGEKERLAALRALVTPGFHPMLNGVCLNVEFSIPVTSSGPVLQRCMPRSTVVQH